MPFDTIAQAAMVVRQVADVTHEGLPCRAVVASRAYPTDIDDLWNAITDKARIPRWFAPVEGDLTLGGKYQIKRSEERRVGKECGSTFRSWGSPDIEKKKK